MNKFYFLLLCASLLILGCKKDFIEVPVTTDGTPVFTLNSQVAGDAFTIVAGDDNYYMYTDWTKDADDVHTFVGRFAEEDCSTNCQASIQFEIRDITPTNNNPQVDNVILPRTMRFADQTMPALDVIQIQFNGSSDAPNPTEKRWVFEGSATETVVGTDNPIHNYVKDALQITTYKVSDASGAISANAKSMDCPSCNVDYSINQLDDGNLSLKPIFNNEKPDFYFWETSGASEDELIINPADYESEFPHTLSAFFGGGIITASLSRSFVVNDNGNASFTTTGFEFDILQEIEGGTKLQLGSFAIQYIDENGKVYRSDRREQPFDSNFSITAVEDYDNNENGQQTKKLDITFSCTVYAEDGAELLINQSQATIAVAYPN